MADEKKISQLPVVANLQDNDFVPVVQNGDTLKALLSQISAYVNSKLPTKFAALSTPRKIEITGDAAWSVNFDGSTNVAADLTLANSGVTAGTFTRVTVDAKGRVTAGQSSALAIANGGTGSTSAAAARTALGAAASGSNSDITSLSALVGTAFAALPMNNGWAALSGFRAVYRKYLGMLQLEVCATGTTTADGTTIATLPTGFRPPIQIAIPVAAPPTTAPAVGVMGGRVTISPDGTVKIFNCGTQVLFTVTLGLE